MQICELYVISLTLCIQGKKNHSFCIKLANVYIKHIYWAVACGNDSNKSWLKKCVHHSITKSS